MKNFDIEISSEEITPESFPIEDNTDYYSLEEYQKAVYSATKQAILDAEKEKSIREAKNTPYATPTPVPTPQLVYVSNMPDSIDVSNLDDIDYTSVNDTIAHYSSNAPDVEFSSSTDANLYTVSTSAPVGSATEQNAVYLLEIRNIVLIFFLLWFVIYIVSMLKRTTKKFSKGE